MTVAEALDLCRYRLGPKGRCRKGPVSESFLLEGHRLVAGGVCISLPGCGLRRYRPCIAFGPEPIPTPGLAPGTKCPTL